MCAGFQAYSFSSKDDGSLPGITGGSLSAISGLGARRQGRGGGVDGSANGMWNFLVDGSIYDKHPSSIATPAELASQVCGDPQRVHESSPYWMA
jgi:hypothetical protein